VNLPERMNPKMNTAYELFTKVRPHEPVGDNECRWTVLTVQPSLNYKIRSGGIRKSLNSLLTSIISARKIFNNRSEKVMAYHSLSNLSIGNFISKIALFLVTWIPHIYNPKIYCRALQPCIKYQLFVLPSIIQLP
jgi:hypothetical protein